MKKKPFSCIRNQIIQKKSFTIGIESLIHQLTSPEEASEAHGLEFFDDIEGTSREVTSIQTSSLRPLECTEL